MVPMVSNRLQLLCYGPRSRRPVHELVLDTALPSAAHMTWTWFISTVHRPHTVYSIQACTHNFILPRKQKPLQEREEALRGKLLSALLPPRGPGAAARQTTRARFTSAVQSRKTWQCTTQIECTDLQQVQCGSALSRQEFETSRHHLHHHRVHFIQQLGQHTPTPATTTTTITTITSIPAYS